MSTLELQQTLAEEITLIHDAEFLTALKSIIDARLSTDVYQLSDYQLKRVEWAHQEWLNGELISSEDLHQELEEWLDTE
jgi:hypothetical protein